MPQAPDGPDDSSTGADPSTGTDESDDDPAPTEAAAGEQDPSSGALETLIGALRARLPSPSTRDDPPS